MNDASMMLAFDQAVAATAAELRPVWDNIVSNTIPDFKASLAELQEKLSEYRDYARFCREWMKDAEARSRGVLMTGSCLEVIDWEHQHRPDLSKANDLLCSAETAFAYLQSRVEFIWMADMHWDNGDGAPAGESVKAATDEAGLQLEAWTRSVHALLSAGDDFAEWHNDVLMKEADGAYGPFDRLIDDDNSPVAKMLLERETHLKHIVEACINSTACRSRASSCLNTLARAYQRFIRRSDQVLKAYEGPAPKAA